MLCLLCRLVAGVALRKESVDRNYKERPGQKARPKSLSARRAWIEIPCAATLRFWAFVALRKESVDRNIARGQLPTPEPPSLSARRAWIEIVAWLDYSEELLSLSARRAWIEIDVNSASGTLSDSRSPQGERG